MRVVCAWCQQRMSGEEDARTISHGICKECMERIEGEFAECCGGSPLPTNNEGADAENQ